MDLPTEAKIAEAVDTLVPFSMFEEISPFLLWVTRGACLASGDQAFACEDVVVQGPDGVHQRLGQPHGSCRAQPAVQPWGAN